MTNFKGFDHVFPFLFFGVPIGGLILRALIGRLAAGLIGAGAAGGIALYLGAPLPIVIFAAIFVGLFCLGGSTNGRRSGYGGGWSSGGSSGGWSSGGSSGGGFSGGGGSSGGGGASGSW